MTAPAPASLIREFDVSAQSTRVFGRVLCTARNHHFIIDGPIQNDCPGEELTPPEVFLSAVASCGVELMHVIARAENIRLDHVDLDIHGVVDRGNQARTDVTLFTEVTLDIVLSGPTNAEATTLVEGFKRRCPLFGTVAVATPNLVVKYRVARR
jgi:uncharacterized OsmC-like protein